MLLPSLPPPPILKTLLPHSLDSHLVPLTHSAGQSEELEETYHQTWWPRRTNGTLHSNETWGALEGGEKKRVRVAWQWIGGENTGDDMADDPSHHHMED